MKEGIHNGLSLGLTGCFFAHLFQRASGYRPGGNGATGPRCPLTIQKNAYRTVIALVFIEGLSIPEYSDALNEVLQLTAVEGGPLADSKRC